MSRRNTHHPLASLIFVASLALGIGLPLYIFDAQSMGIRVTATVVGALIASIVGFTQALKIERRAAASKRQAAALAARGSATTDFRSTEVPSNPVPQAVAAPSKSVQQAVAASASASATKRIVHLGPPPTTCSVTDTAAEPRIDSLSEHSPYRPKKQSCGLCKGTGRNRSTFSTCTDCGGTGWAPPESWTPKTLANALNSWSYDYREELEAAVKYIRHFGVSLYTQVFHELKGVVPSADERMAELGKDIGEPAILMLLKVLRTTQNDWNSPWGHAASILVHLKEPRAIPLMALSLPPSCSRQDQSVIQMIGEIGHRDSVPVLVNQLIIASERVRQESSAKHGTELRVLENTSQLLELNLQKHATSLDRQTLIQISELADVGPVTGAFTNLEETWEETKTFDLSKVRNLALQALRSSGR
jgi:hypothetical protein